MSSASVLQGRAAVSAACSAAGLAFAIASAVATYGLATTGTAFAVTTHTSGSPTGAAPAYPHDFPDPTVMTVGSTYYAYSTEGFLTDIPTMSSTDLVNWSPVTDALPHLPTWAEWGYTWAPTVEPDANGGYVMFYTARETSSRRQCIGRATAETPSGPFVDPASQPFLCQVAEGGSIDPSIFTDANGASYLLWKSDGNAIGQLPQIYGAPLTSGLDALTAAPSPLIGTTQPWEGGIVEGPTMARNGASYELLFGGNDWWTAQYEVGHATCSSPLGPCIVDRADPVGTATAGFAGPGGPSFFYGADGELLLAFHAWMGSVVGYPYGARALYITPVRFWGDFPLFGSLAPSPPPSSYGRVAAGVASPPSNLNTVSVGVLAPGRASGAPVSGVAPHAPSPGPDIAAVSEPGPPSPGQVDPQDGSASQCPAPTVSVSSDTTGWVPVGWSVPIWHSLLGGTCQPTGD